MRRLIIVAAAFMSLAITISATTTSAKACTPAVPEVKDGSIKLKAVICALAGQSPVLMKELRKELINEGVNSKDVTCTSVALGPKFTDVGDLRIPPFNCKIGGKFLFINGDVLTYDARGRAGPRPKYARFLVLANPKWSWR